MGELGHHVTLIAPRGSVKPPRGRLIETMDARSKFEDEEPAFEIYKHFLPEFDVIIDDSHMKYAYIYKGLNLDSHILGVLHTHPTYHTPPSFNGNRIPKPTFVAVSKSHAMRYSGVLGIVIHTAYNGIDMRKYKFQREKSNRYLWVGRFEPFKGAHVAVYLAKTLKFPLDMVGKTYDSEPNYVNQVMAEAKGQPNINFLGEVDEATLIKLYQNARALIFPCMWEEPLGLVQLEAQACGTPVISTTMGAIPETVRHGSTGFLSTSVEEMGEYIGAVDTIDPNVCRKFISDNFSKEVMARRYEQLILKAIEEGGW